MIPLDLMPLLLAMIIPGTVAATAVAPAGGAPEVAILDEAGNAILDESGNAILEE